MPEKEKLFSDFPPVSTTQWESKIIEDIKGADYKKKLIWKSPEDIYVKPYYRTEDTDNLDYLDLIADLQPFLNNKTPAYGKWLIRQDIKVINPANANIKALDILNKGVNSISFLINNKFIDNNIKILLKNLHFDCIELNIIAHEKTYSIFNEYIKLIETKKYDLSLINGTAGFDPIGNLVTQGNFYFNSEKESYNQLIRLFSILKQLPKLRLITVNGKHFHNAGSNIIQELAFSLAIGNEYLVKLTELGLTIDEIAKKIDFSLAIGSNFFFEIAKLRAARVLWANVVKAYNPNNKRPCQTYFHAETSLWNKTIYDSYTNILRSATESMAASLGGVNSLTIHPYNSHYDNSNNFSERIARNQQLILNEEANLSKTIDPSAGSYYIENLTNEIAEKAWALFQEIEKEGGFINAFLKGIIQDIIKKSAQKKDHALAYRKEIILGINHYPNINEVINLNSKKLINNNIPEIAKPIKIYRGSTAFENLRLKTDAYSKNNKRPVVFNLTFGNATMRRARAQFSNNFFGCAGFKIIDNNGFTTIYEGINAAQKAQANIIVLCSSNDEYNKINTSLIKKVNDEILVIAGYPKTIIEKLYALGITNFIHQKTNAIEELKKYQNLLKI